MPIDYTWSSLLIEFQEGKEFGSGIFYRDSATSNCYIITAKHVIEKYIKTDNKADSISLVTFYGKNKQNKDSVNIQFLFLNLDKLCSKNLIKVHPNKDIAVIKFANLSRTNFTLYDGVALYSLPNILPGHPIVFGIGNISYFKDVRPTRDVFVFGYPRTIGLEKKAQYDFNVPLIQKGIISAKDNERSTFIINCSVYGGNSGGPVVEVNAVNNQIRLIGLITEYIPYVNKDTYIESNSGYSVVVSIEHALQLMN